MDVLDTVRFCEDLHVLPKAGGLLDQDSLWVDFFRKIKEFDSIRAELDRKQPGNQ
jgi:hypothetical protein